MYLSLIQCCVHPNNIIMKIFSDRKNYIRFLFDRLNGRPNLPIYMWHILSGHATVDFYLYIHWLYVTVDFLYCVCSILNHAIPQWISIVYMFVNISSGHTTVDFFSLRICNIFPQIMPWWTSYDINLVSYGRENVMKNWRTYWPEGLFNAYSKIIYFRFYQ